jgi:hypothetical protein
MNLLADIFEFFKGINYFGWQENIKIIFLALTFIFLFITIYAYIRAHLIMKSHHEHFLHEHHEVHEEHGTDEHHVGQHETETVHSEVWDDIVRRANSVRDADWKLAVIEADKFVDEALKAKGFAGETMGERLMIIKPQELSSLQDLWDAHKSRRWAQSTLLKKCFVNSVS